MAEMIAVSRQKQRTSRSGRVQAGRQVAQGTTGRDNSSSKGEGVKDHFCGDVVVMLGSAGEQEKVKKRCCGRPLKLSFLGQSARSVFSRFFHALN